MKFRETSEDQGETRGRKTILTSSRLALASALTILGVSAAACGEHEGVTTISNNEVKAQGGSNESERYGIGIEYDFYPNGTATRTSTLADNNGSYRTMMFCEPTGNQTYDLVEMVNFTSPERSVGHIACADGQITAEDFVNETPR